MLYYGIPTYTQFAKARQAIEVLRESSTLVPDKFIVMDNSEKFSALPVFQSLIETDRRVYVFPRSKNILAGAWNELMRMCGDNDTMIIANDDVIPDKRSIQSLVDTAENYPHYAMVNGSGDSGNSYSFFLLQKWAFNQIGDFDERFIPAYFEDNDYDYRLKLAGLIRYTDVNATFYHYGSATMRNATPEQLAQHHRRFAANEALYVKKWGDRPGIERFTIPFQNSVVKGDLEDD